jgi:hypothetical protein
MSDFVEQNVKFNTHWKHYFEVKIFTGILCPLAFIA